MCRWPRLSKGGPGRSVPTSQADLVEAAGRPWTAAAGTRVRQWGPRRPPGDPPRNIHGPSLSRGCLQPGPGTKKGKFHIPILPHLPPNHTVPTPASRRTVASLLSCPRLPCCLSINFYLLCSAEMNSVTAQPPAWPQPVTPPHPRGDSEWKTELLSQDTVEEAGPRTDRPGVVAPSPGRGGRTGGRRRGARGSWRPWMSCACWSGRGRDCECPQLLERHTEKGEVHCM